MKCIEIIFASSNLIIYMYKNPNGDIKSKLEVCTYTPSEVVGHTYQFHRHNAKLLSVLSNKPRLDVWNNPDLLPA